MKTRFILDNGDYGPQTYAERAMCIRGLGEAALLAQVEHAAITHDHAWLRSMLHVGVFSFSREIIQDHEVGASVEAFSKLSSLLSASVIENFMVPGPDPDLPLMTDRLVMNTTLEFQEVFGELVDHAIQQDQRYREELEEAGNGSLSSVPATRLTLMFNGLLASACALDRPDLAEKLLSHRPQLVDIRVDLDWKHFVLRNRLDNGLRPLDADIKHLPAFFALQFGSLDCLDVLRKARGGNPLSYAFKKPDGLEIGLIAMKGDPTFGLLESFDVLVPLCDPEVVRATIEADCYLTRPGTRTRMLSLVAESLKERSFEKRMDVYAPVFESVGGFAIDPTTTLVCALESRWPTYTRAHYGTVDWKVVFGCETADDFSLATQTVLGSENCSASEIKRSDAALAGAIDHAVADGAAAWVRSVQAQTRSWSTPDVGPVLPQPMAGIVIQNFSQSLLALMKAGVDPTRPLLPEAWTLVQMADARNAPMAHTMRTFTNRGRALDLLDEMEPKARLSP